MTDQTSPVCDRGAWYNYDAYGNTQLGARGWPLIAAIALRPIPGDGGDDAGGGRYFADTLVERVSNVKIADAVHRDTFWPIQFGAGRTPAVTALAFRSIACHRVDMAA